MNSNIWMYFIIGIVVSVIMKYLTRPTGKEILSDATGFVHLRMNKFYQVLGIAGLIFSVAFFVFIPLSADTISANLILMTACLVLLFVSTSVYCILFYKNHKVVFDHQTLEVKSAMGKIKSIPWTTIKSVNFNAMTGMIEINKSEDKISIHQHLVGLETLINKIEKKTGRSAKELNLLQLKKRKV